MGKINWRGVLISGLIVGTADILCACINANIQNNLKPGFILEYIASGVFGAKAFGGGLGMQLAGLLFHFIIAYALTVVFFLLRPSSAMKIFTGIVYGCFAWVITNLVIVPLSEIPLPKRPFDPWQAALNAGILIVAIGIPLAYLEPYFRKKRS